MRFLGRDDSPERRRDQVDQAVASALAAEPQPVTMEDGAARRVYPKSYHALRWLDSLDRLVVLARQEASQPIDSSAEAAVAATAPLMESLAVRVWAWILTDPSPGLPFPDDAENPEPPAWTGRMSPRDVLAIASAHIAVNHRRNTIIAAAFPPEAGDGAGARLSLSGFMGTVADDLGVRPFELMRRWTLGELFAQRVVSAHAQREAYRKAKETAA